MIESRQMSDDEKYKYLLNNISLDYKYIPSFVQEHLGNQAAAELRSIWEKRFRQTPENISVGEKYEITYGNWIWIAKNTYSFIREQMGEEGIKQYERAEIEELKQKISGVPMFILKLVRAVSPGSAFTMIARQLSYQLQWLTPLSISELTRQKLVVQIPQCKILDFPDSDDLCLIGCQRTYSIWLAEQFRMVMQTERQGSGCTKIITPF
ncbi:hypothetical protein ACFLWW_00060 [Chloroflexota bacterium]